MNNPSMEISFNMTWKFFSKSAPPILHHQNCPTVSHRDTPAAPSNSPHRDLDSSSSNPPPGSLCPRTAGLLQKLQQQQRKNNGVIIHDFKFDTRNDWKPIGFEGPLISDKLKFSNNSCSILLMLLCFCARWFFSLLLTLEKWKCTQLTKPIAGLSWGQGNLPKSNRSTAWTSNPGRRVNPHPRCSRSSVSEQWCRPLALASSSALPAGLGAISVPKRTWFTPINHERCLMFKMWMNQKLSRSHRVRWRGEHPQITTTWRETMPIAGFYVHTIPCPHFIQPYISDICVYA